MRLWSRSTVICATSASTPNGFSRWERARTKIEVWRQDYNESRPRTSLSWLPPIEYAAAQAAKAAKAAE